MKRNDKQALRDKSAAELTKIVEDSRRELLGGRTSKITEGKTLGVKGRMIRRNVARCLTLLTQKQQAAKG